MKAVAVSSVSKGSLEFILFLTFQKGLYQDFGKYELCAAGTLAL
jgi:hypothetical protein